jgi:hypothetical protein
MVALAATCSRHVVEESTITPGMFVIWDADEKKHRGHPTPTGRIVYEYKTHRVAELMTEFYDENPEYPLWDEDAVRCDKNI